MELGQVSEDVSRSSLIQYVITAPDTARDAAIGELNINT